MSRIRLAATAATITCGLMLVGGTGVASAQERRRAGRAAHQDVALTGSKGFKGTYTIERFVTKGGKLYAVGTLTGKLGDKKVTKENVRMPATLTGAERRIGRRRSRRSRTPARSSTSSLGPINLNLLGLSVRTNQINLRIDAVPGAGNLLGNLLCGITASSTRTRSRTRRSASSRRS